MVSILDRLYVQKKKQEGYSEPEPPLEPNIFYQDQTAESWYCFVPRAVNKRLLARGLIPKNGKVSVYTISSFNIMNLDPEVTISKLRRIYDDANFRINQDVQNGLTISLLGVSLGNVLSIRAATNVQEGKLGRLVSIVGGDRLGLSAWDSILMKNIVRSPVLSAQEYEKRVSEFSPIHYVREINPQKIFARFGLSDLVVSYKYGKGLAQGFERIDCDQDIRTYSYADHCTTIFLSSLDGVYN